jgi:hypothetical protein
MGQYHKLVNLDRREYIDPHKLGCGLKQWEQLANHPGTGAALLVLLASASTGDGGGDFADYHRGHPTIGRWRGDRITMVGDYDEAVNYSIGGDNNRDLTGAEIYQSCDPEAPEGERWTDVSEGVCTVIEHELSGKFKGDGWRDFVTGEGETTKALNPDMILRSR